MKINTCEAICDLIVSEKFKEMLPLRVAMYVGDHKDLTTALDVAVVADEYVITYRGAYEPCWRKAGIS